MSGWFQDEPYLSMELRIISSLRIQMEAGNRVIVRPDATGCTLGPGGREFGCGGSVADSAVRLGVGWLAVRPGRE